MPVKKPMNLNHINKLNADEALEAFLKCCGSVIWARSMVAARPFSNDSDLLRAAETAFTSMEKSDWLDAFAAHPKIGDLNSLRQKYGNTKDWAQNEQSGVAGTSSEVLENLAAGNSAYEERFGYIFIVCATGRSAAEMLEILNSRVDNDADIEFKVAAEEQKKITRIRLEKI
jgi:2-oxo-4-hydroxy-4-carboxy-5-ureidoimidazoline decarboxylase